MKKLLVTTLVITLLLAIPIIASAHSDAYKIKKGDTLSEIAKAHDLSIEQILELNPKITNPDLIFAGDRLNLATKDVLDVRESNEGSSSSDSASQASSDTLSISAEEKDLLARVVHAEAKGESFEGKVAVAHVVLNRVEHDNFPNTIREVIYQPRQFQPVTNGAIYQRADADSIKAVEEALANRSDTKGSIYFYNPRIATSSWIFSRETVKVIGNHVFAR